MKSIFDTPPMHVNEKGIKFWLDKDTTKYGLSIGLKNVEVLLAEFPDGERIRLITENGEPVYENTRLEDVLVHLDIMKLINEG